MAALGQEQFFRDRVGAGGSAAGVLLVAFDGDLPVGDVYVRFAPADEPELRERLPDVPLLQHFEVHPEHRNQGVGRRLISDALQLLLERGHRWVALGVEPANAAAIRLYERLRFHDWGHGEVQTVREVFDPDGSRRSIPERCRILVRDLAEPLAEPWRPD